jgi:hypothetical protein
VRRLTASTDLPFRRIEVAPGYELQVDYGSGAACLDEAGKPCRTHVFRGVLSFSRKGYSEAVRRLTTESFIRSLENSFWALGGVPQVVVFDNAKAVVTQADWYDPELHPKIVEFCRHYDFTLLPTRPRTPRHKGKVERGVGYTKSNALRGRQFDSLAAENEFLRHWERTIIPTSAARSIDAANSQTCLKPATFVAVAANANESILSGSRGLIFPFAASRRLLICSILDVLLASLKSSNSTHAESHW